MELAIHVAPDAIAQPGANCTEDAPCPLKKGLSVAGIGDTIQMTAGRFNTTVVIPERLAALRFIGEGQHITIIAPEACAAKTRARASEAPECVVAALENRAPQVKAKGFGVSLEGNWTGGGLEAGLLLAATAVQSSVKEVMVTTGVFGEGQQLAGISLSGAVGAVVESVSVQGPFMDGIHVAGVECKVCCALVDGARRVGILVENQGLVPSISNKVKKSVVENIGDRSGNGTAVEIQGSGTKLKKLVIRNWGKYGVHVCGAAGAAGCDTCHYSEALKDLPAESPAKTAVQTTVKKVRFAGEGLREICDGGMGTQVKKIKHRGDADVAATWEGRLEDFRAWV